MAVNSAQQGCDSYSVVALPEEGNPVPHCEFPEAKSTPMEDYMLLKSQISLENVGVYSECIEKDGDIEKGNEKTVRNLKNEEEQMKSLQKQISFEMGGKYMQLLMNHSLILPKFSTRDKSAADKAVEAPRMRKYKRSASFNSRKVVLLFSVLSSFGTIILIYLTLRVRQIGDHASINSI